MILIEEGAENWASKEESTVGVESPKKNMAPEQPREAAGDGNLDLPQEVLLILEKDGMVDSLQLATRKGLDHQKIVGAIKSLECLGDVMPIEFFVSKKNSKVAPSGGA